jgi:hypothetical protein
VRPLWVVFGARRVEHRVMSPACPVCVRANLVSVGPRWGYRGEGSMAATAGRCRQRLLTCTRSFREQAHVPAEQSPSREDARLQAAHAHPGRAGRARRAAPQGPCASQRLTSEVSSRSVLAGTPLVGARLVRAPLGVPVLAVTMLSVLARVPLVRVLSRRALGRGAMAREMPRRAVPVAGAQPSR